MMRLFVLFTNTLKTRLITTLTNISSHRGKVQAEPKMRTQVLRIIQKGLIVIRGGDLEPCRPLVA